MKKKNLGELKIVPQEDRVSPNSVFTTIGDDGQFFEVENEAFDNIAKQAKETREKDVVDAKERFEMLLLQIHQQEINKSLDYLQAQMKKEETDKAWIAQRLEQLGSRLDIPVEWKVVAAVELHDARGTKLMSKFGITVLAITEIWHQMGFYKDEPMYKILTDHMLSKDRSSKGQLHQIKDKIWGFYDSTDADLLEYQNHLNELSPLENKGPSFMTLWISKLQESGVVMKPVNLKVSNIRKRKELHKEILEGKKVWEKFTRRSTQDLAFQVWAKGDRRVEAVKVALEVEKQLETEAAMAVE